MPGTKLHRALERTAREDLVLMERRHFSERESLDMRHEKERLEAQSKWNIAYFAAYPDGESPRED